MRLIKRLCLGDPDDLSRALELGEIFCLAVGEVSVSGWGGICRQRSRRLLNYFEQGWRDRPDPQGLAGLAERTAGYFLEEITGPGPFDDMIGPPTANLLAVATSPVDARCVWVGGSEAVLLKGRGAVARNRPDTLATQLAGQFEMPPDHIARSCQTASISLDRAHRFQQESWRMPAEGRLILAKFACLFSLERVQELLDMPPRDAMKFLNQTHCFVSYAWNDR